MKIRIPTIQEIKKYRRIFEGLGIVSVFGIVLYEKYKIKKILTKLVDTSALEIDRKRPDYIYIKYHIYRESLEKIREREQDKNWVNVIINPFGKWWKTFKHSVAWRLLNIAQNGDQHERLKAVRQLSRIDHLKDWDFRHLAQICDARTAVSLARSDCDNRWFVPVHKHGIIKNPKLLLSDIRKLIESLKPLPCTEHFFKKHFNFSHTEVKDTDMNQVYVQNTPLLRQDIDLLKECVTFLYHVTKDVAVCKKLVAQGGLLTLMELSKIFSNDNETQATICKTMAHISLTDNAVDDFFVSGWIGVLAKFTNHPDVRLQVISSKVLANLDRDDLYRSSYLTNIYALHPRTRRRGNPKLDVVFIHGLLGSVFITWRQKDREPDELGLYGKNAFYTSESDDIFLVDETKRASNKSSPIVNDIKVDPKNQSRESFVPSDTPVINKTKKVISKSSGISDLATKELVETLEMSSELSHDWEVVFPDCPLKSNKESEGNFSVSGDTWINDDDMEEYTNCWPMDWLPEDYPNIRIIGVDYTSAVSHWSSNFSKYCPCEKGECHIEKRASLLLEQLRHAEIGSQRPVVWVGHSMGGILCKHILLKAMESGDPKLRAMAKNTKGIIFLGTPHRGSSIARWKHNIQVILSPSVEVKELEENAPKLLDMHNRFMKAIETHFKNLKIVSIAEGTPTMLTTFKFPLRIVTEESAFMNYGDFYVMKDNHLSLSKPIFRQSFLYQRLLKVIDDSLKTPIDDIEEEIIQSPMNKRQRPQNISESITNLLYKFLQPVET